MRLHLLWVDTKEFASRLRGNSMFSFLRNGQTVPKWHHSCTILGSHPQWVRGCCSTPYQPLVLSVLWILVSVSGVGVSVRVRSIFSHLHMWDAFEGS
jgi:hypothetical protein